MMTDASPQRDDPIAPTSIEHFVDEDIDPETGVTHFYYNYLVYTFAHPQGETFARSYLDEIQKVALYLPKGVTETDPIVVRIIDYLARRYGSVQRLTDKGYVDIASDRFAR